jgi:hypothetical protein
VSKWVRLLLAAVYEPPSLHSAFWASAGSATVPTTRNTAIPPAEAILTLSFQNIFTYLPELSVRGGSAVEGVNFCSDCRFRRQSGHQIPLRLTVENRAPHWQVTSRMRESQVPFLFIAADRVPRAPAPDVPIIRPRAPEAAMASLA